VTFQILSLSGGGFLGLYTAAVLAELETTTKGRIADHFDLLAGTSVGGIIALGLAARTPAEDIRSAFVEHGPKIFSAERPPQADLLKKLSLRKNAFRAKYGTAGLRAIIDRIVGSEVKLGSLRHRVIVPAVNLTKGAPQVFKTDHHPTFVRDWRLPVVDVALATAAAPTFFPLHQIGGELFADGGLYANAPDQIAVHEAEHFLHQSIDDVRLLSIGTTTSKFSFSNSATANLGWIGWMDNQRLPRVMIAAQQLNADYMLHQRLGERYLRIDHEQSAEQERYLALDVASEGAIGDLQALAEASIREHLGRRFLPDILTHIAAPAIFYNRTE
jgi:patatin-like phospholipase/acyl hydrolase